jgi:hypothetical protein
VRENAGIKLARGEAMLVVTGGMLNTPHELIGGMSEKKTRLPAPRRWCHSHRRHSSYERVMPKISDLGSEI